MSVREVRWERMFPDQLEEAFADCPIVYFPYGLCEPHGPHCALGLDALKAYGVAQRAARAHGGIVAPLDFWHIHELSGYAIWSRRCVGEVERTWLTCMPPWQHFKNVCYQLRQADAIGFQGIILLTGHYGPNWRDLKRLVELVQPYIGARIYSLPDSEANKPGFDNDNRSGGDHAGKVETSLLWELYPELVDVSRLPDPDDEGTHFAMGKNAYLSNRQVGARMVADEVRYLGERAQELLTAYETEKPQQRLQTFAQVEQMWEEAVKPHLPDFETMQDMWNDETPVPEDSVWHANWRVPKIP